MGFLKDVKTDMVLKPVSKAWDDGKPVCVVRLNMPATDAGASGEIGFWSDTIAAVEEIGWRLDRFTSSSDSKGRPELVLLFRRA